MVAEAGKETARRVSRFVATKAVAASPAAIRRSVRSPLLRGGGGGGAAVALSCIPFLLYFQKWKVSLSKKCRGTEGGRRQEEEKLRWEEEMGHGFWVGCKCRE